MNQLIEIWSKKPAWEALGATEQQAFINGILEKVGPLMEVGLKLVASGFIELKLPNSLPFQYYAFWESDDPTLVSKFAETLRDEGWFNYFDQLNIAGLAEPLPGVLANHITS
ncbi:MAG: DUF6616 family protein [Hyphomonadaceae bacterium]|jgi:hypothetical protein|nr:hypothetical protein [Hyphomonadaceae bacterium]MCZ8195768.1 hypothetical protein [Aquidulcibacter sp.]